MERRWPSDKVLLKLFYLAPRDISKKWTNAYSGLGGCTKPLYH